MHIRARTASMLLVLSGLVGWQGAVTQEKSPTIIDVANSGAIANSGNDATQAVQAAIRAAAQVEGPVRITFHAGRYDFFPEHATRMKYWISNTCSHDECSDETKTIGIYLHDMRNLTIDGEGALLMFHGKMLTIALDGCQNVLLHDLHIDFARPTMSEMTVVAVGDHSLDARVHPDSPYRIEDGKLVFIGEG